MPDLAGLFSGLLLRVAKHWIAGETFEDAVMRAQQSSTHNIRSIINLLGEEITAREEASAAAAEYLEILKKIDRRRIQGCISVKPTQVGLSIDESLFKDNLGKILSTRNSWATSSG